MRAFEIPALPEADAFHMGEGKTHYRYEDVAQDGRLRIEGVWPSMGRILWGQSNIAPALGRMAMRHGIRSILTRVVMEGGSDPISPREAAHTEVRWRLEHTKNDDGEVERVLLNTWLVTTAPRRESDNPVSGGTGDRVVAARAYGQHVFTKPLVKPPNHRVSRLEDESLPAVPERRGRWLAPEELLAVPESAEAIDESPRLDPTPIVFGLAHTDGNQHVNFLTYPRLGEDAALRRLYDDGVRTPLLARRAELGYRKPCFAGDRMRMALQAFRAGEGRGVIVAFVPESDDLPREGDWKDFGRAHCTARILLSR